MKKTRAPRRYNPKQSAASAFPRSRRQQPRRPPPSNFKTSKRKPPPRNLEGEIRKGRQLLNDIQRITRLGNWEWDIRDNSLAWSDELFRIFGLQKQNFVPTYDAYLDRVHPEDREHAKATIEAALREKKSFADAYRIIRPDGTVRFLQTEGEVTTDKNGKPMRMLGCCLDITERKQAEIRLAASNSLLNATLESTADGILVVDLDGKLARFNHRFLEMWHLPARFLGSYRDKDALALALEQLKDPELFLKKVQYLYQHPAEESFDVLEFKDGRIFERLSRPQRIENKIIGRVWSFRDETKRYRAVETLRQSEERYRSLIVASSQVVWRTDKNGLLLDDAASCSLFTGWRFDKTSKESWLEAVHPEDRLRASEVWSRALTTGSVYDTEYRLRRADGQWRVMHVRGVPVFEPSGAIREWIGFCNDITERKQAEQTVLRQRDFMDAVVNSLPGIFYVLDETGLNLRWNKNLEVLTGYSKNEISKMHAINFVPEEERPMLAERVRKVFSEGEADAKIHLLSKSGKRTLHFCTGKRVILEGKPRLVGMGIDISQLERARLEIRKLNRDLGRRVKERTAQLDATNKELESFSYSVSHDLRAPLRAISGFARILIDDHGKKLDEEGRLFIEKILRASDRMAHLIEDLLMYSRIGKSAVNLVPVDLSNLIQQIANDFAQRIDAIGGTLSISHDLPVVFGDVTLLSQAFANLFENAIKYRKSNVPLEISVSSTTEGKHSIICVTDNGIGIAPANHQRIFEVFQRLHTGQQFPGTGIGLANAKKSIEILGGKIWVDSELEKGSTFCIALLSTSEPAMNNLETTRSKSLE